MLVLKGGLRGILKTDLFRMDLNINNISRYCEKFITFIKIFQMGC